MKWIFRGFDAMGRKGWVYGDLVHNQKVTETGLEPRVMVGGYDVIPESVGLCTGIKDIDGKMIYDGDIIRISYNGKHLFDATVEWIDRYGGFYMNEGDGCYSPIPHDYVTVIGNVFHDKELIER